MSPGGRLLAVSLGAALQKQRCKNALEHRHPGRMKTNCSKNRRKAKSDKKAVKFESSVDRFVEGVRASHKIPGITVAVSVDGRLVYMKAFGYQDVENQIPATVGMRAKVASISKLFTAHAWMKLAEAQEAMKQATLHDILAEYPRVLTVNTKKQEYHKWKLKDNYPIPAWSFLAHSSGMCHYTTRESQYVFGNFRNSTHAHIAMGHRHKWFKKFPGMYRSAKNGDLQPMETYSSFGINLIGVMLERLQHLDFQQYSALLMGELGLSNTSYCKDDEVELDFHYGYNHSCQKLASMPNIVHETASDFSHKLPSEGVVSTVEDLVKFGNIYARMYRQKKSLAPLQHKTVSDAFSMHSGCFDSDKGQSSGYGIGWHLRCDTKARSLEASHSGIGMGNTASLVVMFKRDGKLPPAVSAFHPAAAWKPPDVRVQSQRVGATALSADERLLNMMPRQRAAVKADLEKSRRRVEHRQRTMMDDADIENQGSDWSKHHRELLERCKFDIGAGNFSRRRDEVVRARRVMSNDSMSVQKRGGGWGRCVVVAMIGNDASKTIHHQARKMACMFAKSYSPRNP